MISLLQLNTNQYEVAVNKKRLKIKDDQNAFLMKLTISAESDPRDLYARFPKYLGEQTKIDGHYANIMTASANDKEIKDKEISSNFY